MTAFTKRVVFTMGGKGGVGKTGVVVALAEWFEANDIPVTLLDFDTENKARGSLKHFFNGHGHESQHSYAGWSGRFR
jgi:MinD superfamily P-loop ATPase